MIFFLLIDFNFFDFFDLEIFWIIFFCFCKRFDIDFDKDELLDILEVWLLDMVFWDCWEGCCCCCDLFFCFGFLDFLIFLELFLLIDEELIWIELGGELDEFILEGEWCCCCKIFFKDFLLDFNDFVIFCFFFDESDFFEEWIVLFNFWLISCWSSV